MLAMWIIRWRRSLRSSGPQHALSEANIGLFFLRDVPQRARSCSSSGLASECSLFLTIRAEHLAKIR